MVDILDIRALTGCCMDALKAVNTKGKACYVRCHTVTIHVQTETPAPAAVTSPTAPPLPVFHNITADEITVRSCA